MGWGGKRPGAGMKPRKGATKRKTPKPEITAPAARSTPAVSTEFLRAIAQASREAARQQKRSADLNPFKLPSFPPAALPPKDLQIPQLAMDEAFQWAQSEWGTAAIFNNVVSEGLLFPGYPYLSELAQRPEYRTMSETIATEMTRKWIKFSSVTSKKEKKVERSLDDEEPEDAPERDVADKVDNEKAAKIKELEDYLTHLHVRDIYAEAIEKEGYFGRMHIFHSDGKDDPAELKTPIGNGRDELSEGKLSKGWLKRLQAVEPIWCYPTTYNAQNPLAVDWYNPQVWYVMGKEIHASRIMRFVFRPVADMLKPAYAFGGLSLTQIAQPYVDIWLKTRASVGEIIHAFSVMVLQTDLNVLMSPQSAANLLARADAFNAFRDNQGLFITNKATEDFKNVSAPLSGLHELQAQSQEHMMSVARIPAVKFTGIQPSGLSSTSEGEIRAFYDTIAAGQNAHVRPNLTRTVDFAMISLWGKRDPEITFDFVPLWELTEKEKAEKRKADAETAQIHIDTGVLHPVEERQRIASDPETPYHDIDVDDVPDLQEEEEEGLEPKGGHPQGGGEGGGGPEGGGASDNAVVPFVGTLYVHRPLKNAAKFIAWAKSVGFKTTLPESDIHVTIAFSKTPVDWDAIPDSARSVKVRGGRRSVEPLGDKGAVVLKFTSHELSARWAQIRETVGASWDHPSYQPHVTITYDSGDLDLSTIEPYSGPLDFGQEEASEIKSKWFESIAEDEFNEADHPRGQPGNAGQFGSGGGSSKSKKKDEGSGKFQAPQYGLTKPASHESTLPLLSSKFSEWKPASSLKMDDLKKVGAQMGSNPGGVYEDDVGQKFYIKKGKTPEHVKNELTAVSLAKLAGARTLDYRPVEGGDFIASQMRKLDKDNANKLDGREIAEIRKDFAAHAWLANWDIAGLGGDNIGTIHGRPTALDLGGALMFRAQGSPKGAAFGDKVGELDTLRKDNKDAAKVFGGMTENEFITSARRVTDIPDAKIKATVKAGGLDPALADKLIKRRDDIAARVAKMEGADQPEKPTSTVTFVSGEKPPVKELNGITFKSWEPPDDWSEVEGQADIDEPEFDIPKGKSPSSGVLIREPDGRTWLMKPKGGYGGYDFTFPKGGAERGLSLQANAIKEAYEETGLKVKIIGHAGDYEGDSTMTRYYTAEREGGTPVDAGPEAAGVSLVPSTRLDAYLNRTRDKKIATEKLAHDEAGFEESKHPRDADGQFSSTGGGGGGSSEDPDNELTTVQFAKSGEKEAEKAPAFMKHWKGTFEKTFDFVVNGPIKKGANYRGLVKHLINTAKTSKFDLAIEPLQKKLGQSYLASASQLIKEASVKGIDNAVQKGLIDKAEKAFQKAKKLGVTTFEPEDAKAIAQSVGIIKEQPKPAPKMEEKITLKEPPKPVAPEIVKAAEAPPPPKPAYPPPTEAELAKAKKNVKLQLQYVPGAPQGSAEAQKLVDKFNEKYEGKTMESMPALIQKVNDFKALTASMIPLMSAEQKAAVLKAQQEQAAAAEKAAKQKAAQEAANAKAAQALKEQQAAAKAKNKEYMDALGISETEASGFDALVEMMSGEGGSSSADLIQKFKSYQKDAEGYGYPITGFQYALVRNYINGGYKKINRALREGSMTASQHVYSRLVNNALDKMPKYSGTVTRGTTLTPEQLSIYKPGHVIEERGFTSSGINFKFNGNVHYTIKASGKRGGDFSKGANTGEREVLFKSHTFFLVHKVENKGGNTYIEMEEVEGHG